MTDRLLICAPMGIEARAIRRGLRAAGSQHSANSAGRCCVPAMAPPGQLTGPESSKPARSASW